MNVKYWRFGHEPKVLVFDNLGMRVNYLTNYTFNMLGLSL